jgi:NhaP-type Na+/H+ or K+/H+ antiporter
METRAAGQSQRQPSYGVYKNLYKLTVGGGVAFWATNFATSLLPIAAEYRAAFSISYIPMVLVESLLGGLMIGCCVSYFLLRFFDQIPTKDPILKSELLSFVALVLAIVMTGGTASRLELSDALHYFLIGAMLNVPRFLILGIVVGYLYKRLYGSGSPATRADQFRSESEKGVRLSTE